ncbi:hypothetical protein VNO77_21928 [Canavalia gladiata]|uniref:Pentatricopeptide repeat-containing protein n=1 Tax=Canavalia gladiata TaxID=3824 RepID=A0AAN9L1L7_CANGL
MVKNWKGSCCCGPRYGSCGYLTSSNGFFIGLPLTLVFVYRSEEKRITEKDNVPLPKNKWPKQITNSLVVQLIQAEKDVHKALLLFHSATAEYSNGFRHDHKTFGLMISRLVTVNQFRPAEGMLERMKQENCEVTEDIFLTLCKGYGRVHSPLDVIRVFRKMEDFQLRPPYNT